MEVKDSVNRAVNNQSLFPITVDKNLEDKFIKKTKSSALVLIPVSIIAVIVMAAIIYVLYNYVGFVRIRFFVIVVFLFPIYAVYNLFSTFGAIKKHDYHFFVGDVLGKTEYDNYVIRGLEDQKISVLFGRKEYGPGERVIVARVKDELNLISAD